MITISARSLLRIFIASLIWPTLLYSVVHKSPEEKWKNCFITTGKHPGRFGDQLILYIRAKLISDAYGIPFLYKPFCFSQELLLHAAHMRYVESKVRKLSIVSLRKASELDEMKDACNTIFQVGFFTECDCMKLLNLRDQVEKIRTLIAPRTPIRQFDHMPGRMSVALHMRRGGGYPLDTVAQYFFKSKFLSDEFYFEGLQGILDAYPKQPLQVLIFTDDPQPSKIADRFRRKFKGFDIKFTYRSDENRHDLNVIEDFFGIAACDFLVRSASSFGRVAQILGNFIMVVSPSGIHRNPDPAKQLVRTLKTPPTGAQCAGILNLFMALRSHGTAAKMVEAQIQEKLATACDDFPALCAIDVDF